MKPLVYKKARRLRNQPTPGSSWHVTKGDTVQVISGDDKGKRARVLRANPEDGPGHARGRQHGQAAQEGDPDHRGRGSSSSPRRSTTPR